MKKLYFFIAAIIVSVMGFFANAQDEPIVEDAQCAYQVKGEFYTVSMASKEDTRTEIFSFTPGGSAIAEYGVKAFKTALNPFRVVAQNKDNSIFVYQNNKAVENKGEGHFEADLILANVDLVKVFDHQPFMTKMGISFMDRASMYDKVEVKADGKIIDGLDAYDAKVEALEGTKFEIRAANGGTIKSVYYNHKELDPVDGVYTVITTDNAQESLIIIDVEMAVDAMAFVDGSFYTISASSKDNPRVEPISFGQGTYSKEYRSFGFKTSSNPFLLKAQNESHNYYVYQNNVMLANSQTGIDAGMFDGEATFAAGDVIKFFDHQPFEAEMEIGFMQDRPVASKQVKVVMDGITVLQGLDQNESTYPCLENTKFQISAVDGYEIKAVYYNNEDVHGEDGVYTVEAKIKGKQMIIIDMLEKKAAMAYADGSFYTIAAQDKENPRVEAFSFGQGEYQNEYKEFKFDASHNPYMLKAQSQWNNVHVFQNGVEIENSPEGKEAQMFMAAATIAENDVIKFFSYDPAKSTVHFTMAGKDASFEQVTIIEDGINEVSGETLENVLQGTKFTIKPNGRIINSVTLNGNEIEGKNGEFTFFIGAQNQVNEVVIGMIEVGEGVVFYDGNFNMISAQSTKNNRVAAFDIAAGDYDNVYEGFSYNKAYNPFTIFAKNVGDINTTFVYINNVEVENSQLGIESNMFRADVNFNEGDVVKIFDKPMKLTDFTVGFMNPDRAASAAKVEVILDCITPWDDLATVDTKKVFLGTKVQIKAVAGATISEVYYCNRKVEPVDGVYAFVINDLNTLANITLAEQNEGRLFIDAEIYTFAAQNKENPRIEAFSKNAGTYEAEYTTFNFNPEGNPYVLKGQAPSELHVYINDVLQENSAEGIEQNMFKKEVNIENGDVIKVFDYTPSWYTVYFNFVNADRVEAAKQVVVTRDEIIPVVGLEGEGFNVSCLHGTKFEIKNAEGGTIKHVWYNETEIDPVDDVYTIKVPGSWSLTECDIVIEVEDPTGIESIIADAIDGKVKVYNLQGMEVKADKLERGIYIVGNKKVYINK